MRRCDPVQLAFRPFAADEVVFVVPEDGVPRRVAWGGAAKLEQSPVLTLYLPKDWGWKVGEDLSVNFLPAARQRRLQDDTAPEGSAEFPHEPSESIRPARIAEARLSFECRVVAAGALAGLDGHHHVVVARVLSAYQRWPRGCAIA
jgi:hypothetical protein